MLTLGQDGGAKYKGKEWVLAFKLWNFPDAWDQNSRIEASICFLFSMPWTLGPMSGLYVVMFVICAHAMRCVTCSQHTAITAGSEVRHIRSRCVSSSIFIAYIIDAAQLQHKAFTIIIIYAAAASPFLICPFHHFLARYWYELIWIDIIRFVIWRVSHNMN
jgi:hypothetical protein